MDTMETFLGLLTHRGLHEDFLCIVGETNARGSNQTRLRLLHLLGEDVFVHFCQITREIDPHEESLCVWVQKFFPTTSFTPRQRRIPTCPTRIQPIRTCQQKTTMTGTKRKEHPPSPKKGSKKLRGMLSAVMNDAVQSVMKKAPIKKASIKKTSKKSIKKKFDKSQKAVKKKVAILFTAGNRQNVKPKQVSKKKPSSKNRNSKGIVYGRGGARRHPPLC